MSFTTLRVIAWTSTICECYSNLAWEVIVVDDNSPDGTQEIAKQLATVYGEDKIVSFAAHFLFCSAKAMSGSETSCWQTWPRVRWICVVHWNSIQFNFFGCRTAYIHGLNFVTGDFVIIMDADFSHHVRSILSVDVASLTYIES